MLENHGTLDFLRSLAMGQEKTKKYKKKRRKNERRRCTIVVTLPWEMKE